MPCVVQPNLQRCPPPELGFDQHRQRPALAPAKIAEAEKHIPANSRVLGSYSNDSIGGEVHDVFSGHIADETRKAYSKLLFTSVVAAKCTGFMQWNGLYLHHLFRLRLRAAICG